MVFARALEDLDKHSGFGRDVRFPKLYREGGRSRRARLREHIDGDYARRRYLQLLIERDPLEDATAVAVFRARGGHVGRLTTRRKCSGPPPPRRAGQRGPSAKASSAPAPESRGDYERGRVLKEIHRPAKLSPELARGVLSACPRWAATTRRRRR